MSSEMHHFQFVTNFLAEMTNFSVILTEKYLYDKELKDLNMQMSYTKKTRFVVLTERYQVSNFLAEMTLF